MEDVAEKTADVLREEVGEENLVGVSYYHREGLGHVYRSDWAEEKYTPEQVDEIVEELRFESLGHMTHEMRQEQSLHATMRMYDDVLDVAVPTSDLRGVVFALDVDGDYSLREVIASVEDATDSIEARHDGGSLQ